MSVKSVFMCNQCGEVSQKWAGKCVNCSAWGSIEESKSALARVDNVGMHGHVKFDRLSSVPIENTIRMMSVKEFDHVCGGGIVPGGVILVAGEPGAGKSTLLLQVCGSVEGLAVYISAEESMSQIRARAERLGLDLDKICCTSASHVEMIIDALSTHKPDLVIVDSIQTISSRQIEGGAGTINQIKMCTNILIDWAKKHNVAMIMVGHVTKEGMIAGPKIVEHMVDTVLYFQSDNTHDNLRILRAMKNRFGSMDAIGVFEVTQRGLISVNNISQAFVQSGVGDNIGSSIFVATDGNRGLIVEMQALISKSYLQFPRRSVVGWDLSRLSMICAIIEKNCKITLSNKDIYFNVIGGMKINDPAADLPAAAAIISSYLEIPLRAKTCALGEISLAGDIRPFNKLDIRLISAVNFGLHNVIIPDNQQIAEKNLCPNIQFINLTKINDLVSYIQKCKI